MRISDWSSDVCSSDLIADYDSVVIFLTVVELEAVLEARAAAAGHKHPQLLLVVLFIRQQFADLVRGRSSEDHRCLVFDHLHIRHDTYPLVKPLTRRASLNSSNRSEEHPSELQSLMRNSHDIFCLK